MLLPGPEYAFREIAVMPIQKWSPDLDEGTKHPERRNCVAGRFLRSRVNQTFGTGGIWLTGPVASSAMKAIRSASDRLRTRSFSIMLAR